MLKGAEAETDRAIARALSDAERDCRSIVELEDEGEPLALAFIPLAPWPGAAIDTVLIMCSRRKSCAKLTLQMFARSKQLTPAETGVLEQLCAGRAAQDIAALQGLRVSTVRTHIKHVRQKTGAGSVREVVRRVACMPQVASALRLVSHK
jgi:DNA-binding CsgD family transcriptional regulator